MKRNKLLLLLALLLTAATGATAQEQWDVVWDFTAWSTETVTALKADAAASKLEGWSDVEKQTDAEAGADPTEAAKDNCFWFAGTVNEDGSLSANGAVIKELKGLKFNSDYAAKRSLAIAVNYPSTNLGVYAGGAYLWLGGSNQTCFTIPGVKAGSKITIEVESNKTSSARGIGLYKNSYAAENLIGEQFTPTAKEAKTWDITEDCDVVVYNTNSCHIYTIKVKAPTAPAGYTVSMKDGVKDADKWTITPNPAEEGQTVTLLYNGRLKVKGVKATSEAPAEATPALSITSPSVGQVIGSDGKNYAYGSLPTGVTAVAKICYVSGSNGLALALTDEDGTMAWSTAKSVCDAHTPAFTGGTWKLASEDEWNNMMSAAGSYSALCEGFSSVGGTNMIPYFYWSSTEFNSDLARDYDFGEGEWSADSKGEVDYVRACLAFTVEQSAKPAATVTTAPTGAAIVGVGKTTALVSGGAADGGTLMYAVTTTNTKPTTTDGFSATVPTAQTITASGKVYVWYYVKGDDTHSDSEIAATAIEVPVADIIWDVTNVSDLEVPGSYSSYEKEGVTLRSNGENEFAMWIDYADPTKVGIAFEAYETGGFNFTAPAGKAFTKIEMKAIGSDGWNESNLGTGWAYNSLTVTWTGSAASTVGLLTGADYFEGARVKSIAFYLSE